MAKVWADTPLALVSETGVQQRPEIPSGHSAIRCAQRMAALHNLILRSFNSSYNQCLGVRPGTTEARDFLKYNQVLYEHILSHHDAEETVFFPMLQEFTGDKGIMDQNIHEHHELEEGLNKLRDYAYNTEPKAYDGQKLQSILDVLAPTLKKHLHGELDTILSLEKYDSKGLETLWVELGKKSRARTSKLRVGVMMVGSGDKTFPVDGKAMIYPELPFFVPYLAEYVLSIPLAGAWRFNPSDSFGAPRPLAFPNPSNVQAE